MLVIDTSQSIGDSEALEAVKAAARGFLTYLDDTYDRVGLVVFNREATLLHPLSGDHASLEAAIAGIDATGGTDIAEGLTTAREHLEQNRRPEASAAIILLSDGMNNEGDDPVEQAAVAVHDARITLVTIGLGEWVNTGLLQIIASPGSFYPAPSSEDLAAIYRSIATVLTCAGGDDPVGS